jgi:energy-coupling factor transport system ATP-binding protein
VLEHLDLTIRPGERVLLAGPSGSGKSTLLRALAGLLLTADSGELSGSVLVDGAQPQATPGSIGLVLQDPGSGVVASTLGRDVAFGLENIQVPSAQMPDRVSAALAEVGLSMPQDSAPATLSGGESQRLALAGALVLEPRGLLLDEPTAMLDAATAATVRSVVDEVVRRRGLTLVVVEHRLDGWLDLVERLVVLDAGGAVVADGEPREVLAEHGESLAEQGIWVPGIPDPTPVALDLPPLPDGAAGVVPDGRVVVAARTVSVEHRSSRLGLPGRSTTAVRGADLDLNAGETVALVGPSGAGKSSLMAALGGLIEPAAGQVKLALDLTPADRHRTRPPHEWRSTELARAVAWVPQRAATTIVGRTVRGDVLTTSYAVGLASETATARADALLRALGLGHLADVDPQRLSGGEQRRLAVASAIAHAPALVLADEPTVGQDRLTWAAVMGILEAARAEGSAVLVTTHDGGVVEGASRTVRLQAPSPAGTDRPHAGLEPAEPAERTRLPLLARVGPLALLLAAFSALPLPALVQNWRQGLAVLVVEVVLGSLGLVAPGRGRAPRGRIRGVLTRLAPAVLGVMGVGWSAWLLGGRDLEVAAGAMLRVAGLILPSAFVVGFIDPEQLGDHLAQRLGLPARPVVAATAALQRLQSFDVLWGELMRTRRVRGIRADRGLVAKVREVGAVTVGLLVGALGQAATLALGMDARGFAEARRRTWAGTAPWRLPDSLAVLCGLLVVAAAAVARITWPG